MPEAGHLYFHSPCFDGIVSCVLVWDFLENHQGWTIQDLHPINYDVRTTWLSTELETPCAIVDFLYHPNARFWADHHLTSFLTEEARADFERRKSEWLIYDEKSGSCAMLLWNHISKSFGYQNSRYKEMVEWADKTDSARYDSVEEAIFGDAPAIKINVSLAKKNEEPCCENLVRKLRYESLEEVARLPEIQDRYEEVRSSNMAGLDRLSKVIRLEDGAIAVFDVDTKDVMINRYSPYHFFPEARYSAGITRSSKGAVITMMRNPWRNFESVYLGRIAEKFGGGGHQRVGAILLRDNRALEADRILEQIVQEIREEDKMSYEGTPP